MLFRVGVAVSKDDSKKTEKLLFIFLIFFSLSVGVFSNYRELWLSANMIGAESISRIISIASFITVLVFTFFTIKVPYTKLKMGVTVSLILKMITSTILICLNNSQDLFLIKFFMFFEIAFNELILSSIYPLIINFNKSNETYTKKKTIEAVCDKLGFLIVSLLIGKTLGKVVFSYNYCLLLSVIFNFIAFIVLLSISDNSSREEELLDFKDIFNYLNKHKIIYLYLITNILSSLIWKSILGMPLLTLTKNLGFSTNYASLLVLTLGIVSNILAIIVVKKWHFKNEHLNMIFKYGLRIILYLLMFISNSKLVFLITLIYLLLLDMPFGFMFKAYFIHKVPEKYAFLMTSLIYCTTLIGNAIGVFICGIVFNYSIRLLIIPTLVISVIHYILTTIMLNKRSKVVY